MLSTLDISCSWILADPDKSGIRATSPLKLPEPAGIPENNRRRSKRDDQDVRFLREINISQIPLRDKYIFCLLTRGPILVEKVQGAMSGRPSHQSADSTDLQIHFSFSVSSSWHYFKGMRLSVLLSQWYISTCLLIFLKVIAQETPHLPPVIEK